MVSRSPVLLEKMMRAIRVTQFGEPNVCKVEQLSKPTAGPNQVLIKTKYSGINPVDTYIRSGSYARKPDLPYTPGSDCSGVVESVGAQVTQFKVGDPVFTVRTVSGANAEYTVAEAMHTCLLNTNKLSFQQGACLGVPFFTAYRSLVMRAEAKAGETVLVHGASGGVGTLCVQIAKHLGLKVLATAGSEEGMKIVKESGADLIYNHKDKDYAEKIMADAGDTGVNIILEMLANVNLQTDLGLLSANGRIVVIGNRGTIDINPRFLMAKESTITGCMLFASTPEDWSKMKEAVARGQEEGWVCPVVSPTKEYTLDTVGQAHIDIVTNSGCKGNLVIKTELA